MFIASVLVAKFSACVPASARTAFFASTDENIAAKATSSPLTDSFSFFRIEPRPSLSRAAAPEEYPIFFKALDISLDGDIKPCMVALSCVVTSLVEPVTPVSVAIAPNSSSWLTFKVLARGTTAPMLAASSGKDVWPSLTVWNAKSAAFCTAAADVSPYPFVTADSIFTESAVSALPALAAFVATSSCFVESAVSPNADTTS